MTIPRRIRYELTYDSSAVRGAGVLRLSRAGASGAADGPARPCVVVLHGLGSSKERSLTTLYALAEAGFDALAVDLYYHGDRPEAELREARVQHDLLGTVTDVIYETLADLPLLCAEQGIEPARAGLLGISAGGFVAHAACVARAAPPPGPATGAARFGVVVAAITSPDWLRVIPGQFIPPGSAAGMMLALESPYERAGEYPPAALCQLTALGDETVSPVGSLALHERLAPIYAARGSSDDLRLVTYPGAGHAFSDAMLGEAIRWFRRGLSAG